MDVAFTVYVALCLASLGLLALLLPLALLPSFVTGVAARDFGLIQSSIVLSGMAKSGFAIAEMMIERQTNIYKTGKLCNVDAGATALLTMAVVSHFPLLAINTHFKVTTRDNPRQKIFSTMWAFLIVFMVYAISVLVGIGILVTWGGKTQIPMGAWAGVHCVPTALWWRIGRIVTLFVPLVLTIVISIPCVLSVTIRHHLFRKRDITNIRLEVGSLVFVAFSAMAFLVAVWVNSRSMWPRPLEGALGLLVFLIVLNEKVLGRYRDWALWCVNFARHKSWGHSSSDENLVADEENAMPPTLGTTVEITRLTTIAEAGSFDSTKK